MSNLRRRDIVCQWAGGAGAIVSCTGMILSLTAGLVGSAGSAMARGGAMAGMSAMGSPAEAQAHASSFLVFLNRIAVPLLLVSILLMLIGVAHGGWRALGLVAAGSALLLVNMFVSTPTVAAAWLLGGGYGFVCVGYVVAWKASHARGVRRGAALSSL